VTDTAAAGVAGQAPGLAADGGGQVAGRAGLAGDGGGHDEYECSRAWSALTAAHARTAGQLSAALARHCGLTINDFEILVRLDHAPGSGLRLGELNSAVPLTQPALSRAVARLADRGCLSRCGAPEDRRGVLIAITPAGRELLSRAIPVHASTVRDVLLSRLTPAEQDVLAAALGRVVSDA
jgi:DNA-binding MarR family transcriptional regulator